MLVLCLIALGGHACTARAQTLSDQAAWFGIMLSPTGALPPIARNGSDGDPWPSELTLRVGYWRYDINDVGHDNYGLTYGRRFGAAHTVVALTGAKMILNCEGCDSWILGGVDVQSTLLDRHFAGNPERPWVTSLGLRETFGGARSTDATHANAVSYSAALVLGLDVPTVRGSYVRASFSPGYGYGRFISPDLTDRGYLPTIGGGLAWTSAWGVGFSLGYQRVIMSGAPASGGLGLTWHFGSHGREHAPDLAQGDATTR
jgi:hypothetical protein